MLDKESFNNYVKQAIDYFRKNDYGEVFIAYFISASDVIAKRYDKLDFRERYFDKKFEEKNEFCKMMYVALTVLDYSGKCNNRHFAKKHKEMCDEFKKSMLSRMYMIISSYGDIVEFYKKYLGGLKRMLFRKKPNDPIIGALLNDTDKFKRAYKICEE